MSSAPRGAIILLEDVDAAFTNKKGADAVAKAETVEISPPGKRSRDNAASSGLSFSGLLNAIDGVAAQEGKLLFLTTNHIERLDPALIRPGRVDVRAEISHASAHTASKLFERFYRGVLPGEELAQMAEKFGSVVSNERLLSMATIQGFLMKYRQNPEDALLNKEKVLEETQTNCISNVSHQEANQPRKARQLQVACSD